MVIASLVNPIAKLAIDPQIKSKYVTKKKKKKLRAVLGCAARPCRAGALQFRALCMTRVVVWSLDVFSEPCHPICLALITDETKVSALLRALPVSVCMAVSVPMISVL